MSRIDVMRPSRISGVVRHGTWLTSPLGVRILTANGGMAAATVKFELSHPVKPTFHRKSGTTNS